MAIIISLMFVYLLVLVFFVRRHVERECALGLQCIEELPIKVKVF